MGEKMRKEVKNFWENGVSIDEARVSVLMIVFVITSAICVYQAIYLGDISVNVLNLQYALITSVAGINIVEKITKKNNPIPNHQDYNYSDNQNETDNKDFR